MARVGPQRHRRGGGVIVYFLKYTLNIFSLQDIIIGVRDVRKLGFDASWPDADLLSPRALRKNPMSAFCHRGCRQAVVTLYQIKRFDERQDTEGSGLRRNVNL
jgi:hypothetical protein